MHSKSLYIFSCSFINSLTTFKPTWLCCCVFIAVYWPWTDLNVNNNIYNRLVSLCPFFLTFRININLLKESLNARLFYHLKWLLRYYWPCTWNLVKINSMKLFLANFIANTCTLEVFEGLEIILFLALLYALLLMNFHCASCLLFLFWNLMLTNSLVFTQLLEFALYFYRMFFI